MQETTLQSEAKRLEIKRLVLETPFKSVALCLLYSTPRSGHCIGASSIPRRITGIGVKLLATLLVLGRIQKYSFCKREKMSWRHALIPMSYRIFVKMGG